MTDDGALVAPFAREAPTPGGPAVRGVLHRPAGAPRAALVLTHGAGGSAEAPLLVAVAEAVATCGVAVLRCDLPFRQARRTGPPPAGSGARDRAGLRQAVSAARGLVASAPVLLGGHSYGGRQATLLAAEDASVAGALLLLAYPLHPPRRPTKPRTAHFPQLRTPALFVHGTRDPFGSIPELDAARAAIPAPTALLATEGSAHDLAGRGRAAAAVRASLALRVASAFLDFAAAAGTA